MIHIVTIGCLGRTPVTPPVMRDDAKAVIQEEHHLGVPIVSAQWPTVREDNWLSASPVLVENMNSVRGLNSVHRLVLIVVVAINQRSMVGSRVAIATGGVAVTAPIHADLCSRLRLSRIRNTLPLISS
jgi:hypothetical protein